MKFSIFRLLLACMTIAIAVVFFPLVILGLVRTLGHFVLAKIFGVGVLEFVIGFGKRLGSIRISDTVFSLGIVPLGGYVRLLGDHALLPEMPTKDASKEALEKQARLIQENRWFINKNYLQKSMIFLAGPVFILCFAFLVQLSGMFYFGIKQPSATIAGTVPGLPAEIAGLKAEDIITAVDGAPLSNWDALIRLVEASHGRALKFSVQRDGKPLEFNIVPSAVPSLSENSTAEQAQQSYKIGIIPKVEKTTPSMRHAILESFKSTLDAIAATINTIFYKSEDTRPYIFAAVQKPEPPSEQEFAVWRLWLLSVALGLLYLLPIPFLLDGGHFMFFTVEALRGAPFNIKYLTLANKFGLAVIPILIIFALIPWGV